jgi:carbamoyltransferase
MAAIDDARIRCSFTEDRVDAILQTARKLAGGHTVAWFSGASEFGPRALGSRSLLGDPRDLDVRKRLLEIKGREAFMPFAPSVLNSAQHQYFAGPGSEYMTVAVRATERAHREIPAAIHSDGTARVQIISDQDGAFARMVRWFGEVTGVELVLNTSLNLRGQPMAESPADAVALFMNSEIDCLYMDGILVAKD